MSARPVVLSIPGHAELHVTTRSGRVTITAEERSDVVIESGAPSRDSIEVDATGRITLTSANKGTSALDVRCPTGSDVGAGTITGTVELQGQFGAVRVTTVSASVTVDGAESLDVRSMTGSIDVRNCSGRCRIQTKSGRAECASAGDILVSTMSGGIHVTNVGGSAKVQTASGSVELSVAGKGGVTVETMSGAVRVAVPRGVRPNARLRSLTGRPRCDCEEGNDLDIDVRSMSGKIEVVPS